MNVNKATERPLTTAVISSPKNVAATPTSSRPASPVPGLTGRPATEGLSKTAAPRSAGVLAPLEVAKAKIKELFGAPGAFAGRPFDPSSLLTDHAAALQSGKTAVLLEHGDQQLLEIGDWRISHHKTGNGVLHTLPVAVDPASGKAHVRIEVQDRKENPDPNGNPLRVAQLPGQFVDAETKVEGQMILPLATPLSPGAESRQIAIQAKAELYDKGNTYIPLEVAQNSAKLQEWCAKENIKLGMEMMVALGCQQTPAELLALPYPASLGNDAPEILKQQHGSRSLKALDATIACILYRDESRKPGGPSLNDFKHYVPKGFKMAVEDPWVAGYRESSGEFHLARRGYGGAQHTLTFVIPPESGEMCIPYVHGEERPAMAGKQTSQLIAGILSDIGSKEAAADAGTKALKNHAVDESEEEGSYKTDLRSVTALTAAPVITGGNTNETKAFAMAYADFDRPSDKFLEASEVITMKEKASIERSISASDFVNSEEFFKKMSEIPAPCADFYAMRFAFLSILQEEIAASRQ